MLMGSKKTKNIYVLHNELGYSSENITWATGKAMGLKITSTFKYAELAFSMKVKQAGVSRTAAVPSKIKD